MGVLGIIINDSCTCRCYLLSIVVDFMILSDIYCFLFWVGRWYLLSTCACTDPYLYVFSLLFVKCSKRTAVFNSTATLASLHHIRFQGELLFLARTRFSLIHVLRPWSSDMDHLFTYFSFLETLRFSNLRIDCSCDDDFLILGIMISF